MKKMDDENVQNNTSHILMLKKLVLQTMGRRIPCMGGFIVQERVSLAGTVELLKNATISTWKLGTRYQLTTKITLCKT